MKKYYVSPDGRDSHEGCLDAPVQSLAFARDLARAACPTESEPVTIHLLPGVHRLTETLRLGPEDGHVTWQGAETGDTLISAGVPLKGWEKCESDLEDVPEAYRGGIWKVQLPEGTVVNSLYGSSGKVARAQGKAFSPVATAHVEPLERSYGPDGETTAQHKFRDVDGKRLYHDRFGIEPGVIPEAGDLEEAEFLLIPKMQWSMSILPLGHVDFENNMVFLAKPCIYPIGVPHCAPEGSIWLENTLSVISPGSWVYHAKTATPYFCTEGEAPDASLEAGCLTELIRVEGEFDPAGAENRVHHLHLRDLTFTRSNRHVFHGLTGKGIQHDWEMHDAPSAMVRLRHAVRCEITGCTFEEGGSTGVRMDLACTENHVEQCTFRHLGGCGVVLCGYGLSYLYESVDNEVVGNHFHHLGEAYWHCPAIFVWQSGRNRIAQNYLHDLPYTGIVCSGRTLVDPEGVAECSGTIQWDDFYEQCGSDYKLRAWYHAGIQNWTLKEPLMHSRENLIEYNEIRDVMQVMGDGNGIYISGAGGGNVVRYNVVGPCPSPTMAEGIRCDDDQHQTILHANLVFAQGGRATGITLKGVNRVTNNILALPTAVPLRGHLSLEVGPLNGSVIKQNLFLTYSPEETFVSEIRIHGKGRVARTMDTDCDRNLYWCLGDPEAGNRWLEHQRSFGVEIDSISCNPGLMDPENVDFHVKEDAAVLQTGFQPLPLDQMFVGKDWE